MKTVKHGWFSKKHSEHSNSSVYSTPNNTEVEVTCVSKEKECPIYGWDDKVYVGEVVEFLHKKSSSKSYIIFEDPLDLKIFF